MREKQHHKILGEETLNAYELGQRDGRAEVIRELMKILRLDEYILEVLDERERRQHD